MQESMMKKKIIADGFKEIMEKKAFEKITIADITDRCGLNRQTFYYHFQDKYELLNWILYSDIILPFSDGLTIENWSDKLLSILKKLKENSRFYTNAMNTSRGEEFRQYLFTAVTEVICEIIDQIAAGYTVSADARRFIAEFFSYGVSGTVIKWVTSGMRRSPEDTAVYMKNLVNDYKAFAVQRYLSENDKAKEQFNE